MTAVVGLDETAVAVVVKTVVQEGEADVPMDDEQHRTIGITKKTPQTIGRIRPTTIGSCPLPKRTQKHPIPMTIPAFDPRMNGQLRHGKKAWCSSKIIHRRAATRLKMIAIN